MAIPGELLTPDEHLAMETSAQLANLVRKIIGDGPEADLDWAESDVSHSRCGANDPRPVAARAFPDLDRPLGGWGLDGGHERGQGQATCSERWHRHERAAAQTHPHGRCPEPQMTRSRRRPDPCSSIHGFNPAWRSSS